MTEITRITLKNGLQVLLKEIHTSPLISSWVWYRVGSRDEVNGQTGASHWVEHMLLLSLFVETRSVNWNSEKMLLIVQQIVQQ